MKPKEFYIAFDDMGENFAFDTEEEAVNAAWAAQNGDGSTKATHVIEHSAYEKLQRENEVLRRGLKFECNNRCAHQNPCNARETLDKADKISGGE